MFTCNTELEHMEPETCLGLITTPLSPAPSPPVLWTPYQSIVACVSSAQSESTTLPRSAFWILRAPILYRPPVPFHPVKQHPCPPHHSLLLEPHPPRRRTRLNLSVSRPVRAHESKPVVPMLHLVLLLVQRIQ